MTTSMPQPLKPIAADLDAVTPLADDQVETCDDVLHIGTQQEALCCVAQSQLTTMSHKRKHARCSHAFLLLCRKPCNYKSDHFA